MYARPNYYYVDRKPRRLIRKKKNERNERIYIINEIIPRCCISKYYDNVMRYTTRLNPRKTNPIVMYHIVMYPCAKKRVVKKKVFCKSARRNKKSALTYCRKLHALDVADAFFEESLIRC